MKKISLFSLCLLTFSYINAQIQNPVHWSFSSKKINSTTYAIHLTATVDKGWHIYSQTTPSGGPIPTAISFTKNPLITVQGTAKETGKLEQRFEPLFDVDVKQFSGKVDFIQIVIVKGAVKTMVAGSVEYMCCNDKECLPPAKQTFSIAIP